MNEIELINKANTREELEVIIKNLILNDFNKLIQILYRIDVDEEKLKQALKNSTQNSEVIIAQMILERQQKKKSSTC
jgi:hypothetical protein